MTRKRLAKLLINGKHVGQVDVRSVADSWGFGEFTPNAGFAEFAPVFGNWSLLMHADDDESKLTPAASDELRRAEYAIDALRAQLVFDNPPESHDVRQLNIDGPLIEWKVVQRQSSRRVG